MITTMIKRYHDIEKLQLQVAVVRFKKTLFAVSSLKLSQVKCSTVIILSSALCHSLSLIVSEMTKQTHQYLLNRKIQDLEMTACLNSKNFPSTAILKISMPHCVIVKNPATHKATISKHGTIISRFSLSTSLWCHAFVLRLRQATDHWRTTKLKKN